ncbi:L-ribulose-5-phosphate 4-epimerase [Pelolinea submarina]|jgi:L-ribulose-5-phosphate 4-epimerase|uniref:L-ribulose-5-phosphate 4-epimerase n=1 Tax=Pelolinea submarina TaxID=913107 RepID=A0A347ZQ78_9CHLR|nr:L-ribulose-5-phosphate 4-epimerase [Pelolinea submarina]REG06212.1 L-ribulose 5-phosphate 4-epimerase [Pelolinea submarina]BBB47459.1 L-ribulose-5-phosphate 4-epimerase [Pelolinea submarina]
MLLKEIREELVELNQALPANRLVVWTGGNVSIRDPKSGLVAIKPSGIMFPDLTPENMVVVDLDGKQLEGDLAPSSDTASHLYIYRHREDINGVVHTHSDYATAFAALGMPIPAVLTAIGDEFGGPIPCGDFALIGSEAIGKAVLDAIGNTTAVLLKNHGVFTIGKSGRAALKSAVMVEDVAKTVWLAKQLGEPCEISQEDLKKLNERYMNVYGQH